jgi:hypothetical protein
MGDNPEHRADDWGEKAVPESIPRIAMTVRETLISAISVTVHETPNRN